MIHWKFWLEQIVKSHMHLEAQLYSNPKLLILKIKSSPNLLTGLRLLQIWKGKKRVKKHEHKKCHSYCSRFHTKATRGNCWQYVWNSQTATAKPEDLKIYIYTKWIYKNPFQGLWERSSVISFFSPKVWMVCMLTYWIHPSCNSSLLKRLKIYKTLMGYGFNASSHYPSSAFLSRSEWSCLLPCNHLPAQLIFSECSRQSLPGSWPASSGCRGPPVWSASATPCVSFFAAGRAKGTREGGITSQSRRGN